MCKRIPEIFPDGATNATVNIGGGGTNAGTINANGGAGTQSTFVIGSRTLYASSGGGGGGATSLNGGGGGGSGGEDNGGSSTSATGGIAGSATPPANTHWQVLVLLDQIVRVLILLTER